MAVPIPATKTVPLFIFYSEDQLAFSDNIHMFQFP